MSSFFTIEDNLKYLLTRYPYLCDARNEEVIIMYRKCIFAKANPSSESIVRTLRKMKQKYSDVYGSKRETILYKQQQTQKFLDYVHSHGVIPQ